MTNFCKKKKNGCIWLFFLFYNTTILIISFLTRNELPVLCYSEFELNRVTNIKPSIVLDWPALLKNSLRVCLKVQPPKNKLIRYKLDALGAKMYKN